MAYLKSGIDGGRQGSSLVRNRVMDIRGDIATPGKLLLTTSEPTVVNGNELGRIDFQAPLDTAGTDAISVAASIYAEADDTFSSSVNATELCFAVGKSGTAAEQMRLDQDGQLGINTSSPASALHVSGTVQVGVDGTGHDVVFYGDSASTNMTWDQDGNTDGQLILNDARLFIDQDDDDVGIAIDSEATNNAALDVTGMFCVNATQDISDGYSGWFDRNIDEAGSHPLVSIIDEDDAVTQSALYVRSDGVGSTSHALEVVGRMRLGGRAAAIQSPTIAWVMS